MYSYNVISVDDVVDDHTVDFTLDLGFSLYHKVRVSLEGIDAPESLTEDIREEAAVIMAKEYLTDILASAEALSVSTMNTGKYGRYFGTIFGVIKRSKLDLDADDEDYIVDEEDPDPSHFGVNINELLITKGHAERYRCSC